MNGCWLVFGSLIYFILAYFIYGKYLKKIFGIDPSRPCPSRTEYDGIDYVPTARPILFGHHFASIAGAGPIVGPVLAAKYGWGPAVMWIIIGCVFIGAMHDFAAMFLSVRHKGRSIAYVIEDELGYVGRQLFLFFCLATLVLVVTVFTVMVAKSFVSSPEVATASILFISIAPIFGILVGKKILTLLEGSLIFVPLLFFCIWLGTIMPLDLAAIFGSETLAANVWIIALLYYAFCASVIPVWILLQPRDYLNSYLLYAMMLLGFAGIFVAKPVLQMHAFAITGAEMIPGVFPLLFVTVACGACSGFHALVASGTSAKQINSEKDIFPISYGSMLVEGILAILAICSVAYLGMDKYTILSKNTAAPMMFANGMGHFCESLHLPFAVGRNFIALALSAFILTSLDTATRLARFVWQELMLPCKEEEAKEIKAAKEAVDSVGQEKLGSLAQASISKFLGNRWIATIIVIAFAAVLAFSGSGKHLWPIFGASNQLLAALTLLAVTLYLFRNKKPYLFAMLPMFFMFLISVWALIVLIIKQWGLHNKTLVTVSVLLLVLAAWLAVLAVKKIKILLHRKE